MTLFKGNGFWILPLLVILMCSKNGWNVFLLMSSGKSEASTDCSSLTVDCTCRAEGSKMRVFQPPLGHATGAEAVPLGRHGLDQLLHPAHLRGHLLGQDLIAVLQAAILAL